MEILTANPWIKIFLEYEIITNVYHLLPIALHDIKNFLRYIIILEWHLSTIMQKIKFFHRQIFKKMAKRLSLFPWLRFFDYTCTPLALQNDSMLMPLVRCYEKLMTTVVVVSQSFFPFFSMADFETFVRHYFFHKWKETVKIGATKKLILQKWMSH